MTQYLFAYGFLKSQFHGSEKTETPEMLVDLVSPGTLKGKIYRVNIYPGVIYDPNCDQEIKGEVFKMQDPETLLHTLDMYENALPLVQLNPDYERRIRPVETPQGILECWVYEYIKPVNPATEIKSGEF
ncbi:MAG: gamma-glutamylcyclotransferase [Cyclobacteriaceae bacterium]